MSPGKTEREKFPLPFSLEFLCKEAVRRLSHLLSSKPLVAPFPQTRNVVVRPQREPILRKEFPFIKAAFSEKSYLPRVVTAGARVLHQPAREVYHGEIASARIEMIIDDLVKVMRKELVVNLSAPQIGVTIIMFTLHVTEIR
nr:peptide deformylase 1A, chloroplastic-like [Tanacetum cinerariifolium]